MFSDIFYRGEMVFENQLIRHYHTAEMLLLYDGNFIQFKRVPTLAELVESVQYLRDFHQQNGQEHVKLLFPENEKIPDELWQYLKNTGFNIGSQEFYYILPSDFAKVDKNQTITVDKVTDQNLCQFLKLAYEIDSEISLDFARQKRDIHVQNFGSQKFMQLMAYYDGNPAGMVDAIIGHETVEIDGLVILPSYRRRGVASQLQQFIMEEFADKRIILVADGEDSVKEMYKNQNYRYGGFKFEALKVY
ncbi:GNAT family N-acetyltransferase [Robertmurraya sp. FSL W8-0741]|uniref:GNAT family N-acetyltransferase n=1 Tax=Robertmurraya sp. FSL W8-0741 TaxID=2954629 RepID=UPI0030F65433